VLSESKGMKEVDSDAIDSIFASRYVQNPLPK
jgi:hypothetical protein